MEEKNKQDDKRKRGEKETSLATSRKRKREFEAAPDRVKMRLIDKRTSEPPRSFLRHPCKRATCEKCDKEHDASVCPHFEKEREDHPDAWGLLGKSELVKKAAAEGPKFVAAARAQIVPQPGDGSCLFHSVAFGLRDGSSGAFLRKEVADAIELHPDLQILGTPIAQWVKMDKGVGPAAYVERLRSGAWGGGIEMALLAKKRGVSIEVFQRCAAGFTRIAKFGAGQRTISVLYTGRLHYDFLRTE